MYDVIIIGCGISGAACAYSLARYDLKVAVLESLSDVANGTTKANSAIIHGGYDPEPGTLMAKLNVKGCAMAETICKKLDVPYKKCGSMVLAFDDADLNHIKMLFERGTINGVPDMKLLTGGEVMAMEPHISKEVKGALLAPSTGIVNPWEYCLAMAETAVRNGVELFLDTEVTGIDAPSGGESAEKLGQNFTQDSGASEALGQNFTIHTRRTAPGKQDEAETTFTCRYVINAAGNDAEAIHRMVGEPSFHTRPVRGQYFLLDKSEGNRVEHVIFPCPNEKGKGVLVAPTVHGNLIVGPDAEDVEFGDTSVTAEGLAAIGEAARRSVPGVDLRENIRNFAGIRARTDHSDFIIEENGLTPGFIDVAGIKSPGLTAAPAIGEYVAALIGGMIERDAAASGTKGASSLTEKTNFIDTRTRVRFHELSLKERNQLIASDPAYGRIVCRCETVTEGEILDALRAPIPPTTINGVKRRCGAGMGRCQGGFCSPRVHEILVRETSLDWEDVCLDQRGSHVITDRTKGETRAEARTGAGSEARSDAMGKLSHTPTNAEGEVR